MKIMNITKIIMLGLGVVTAGVQSLAAGPTVTNVKAQQRWPWNGLVDIDYTINGDASGLGVLITMKDISTGASYTPTKFHETLPTSAGTHRVTWSTEEEGLTSIVTSQMVATVSLMRIVDTPAVTNDLLVIDLSGGPTAISYPISYLDAVPNGGVWPDEYKTTKLVLRKIPAGSVNSITNTQPFYAGVFEVTQKQYELVMGSNPSSYKGDKRAVECVSYNMIRGESAGAGWPGSSAVDATSFLGKLRARTALSSLDLPTEAQWEYACRAGTTSDYNNGGSTEADLKTLGRYSGNQNDGRGGYSGSGTTTVGSYAPNAWGLYDMHGNAHEWCLDWYSSGANRVMRGGSWDYGAGYCRSSFRYYGYPSDDYFDYGFRLFCSAAPQGFVETDLAADENSNVTVRVFGGNLDRTSSVKVYLKGNSAGGKDYDVNKTLVDGRSAKKVTFPVTLKWAAGEVGEKTVVLKLKKDALAEGPEFLTLQLGGELGMALGEARTCTVRINDLSANPLKASAKNPSKTKGVKKFAVTTLSADETMGLVSPSNSWYKGAKLTVKAAAKTGYAFAGWYDVATGKKVSSKTSYAFTVAKDVTLEARFSKRYYLRVLADPADGGTASGSGWYATGKVATMKATKKEHFKFLGWFAADADDINVVGTNKLSGSATYKPTVTNDCTIYARFESEPRLEIFNGNSKGGTVSGANKYAAGKTVKLTAKPKKGYAFVGWTDFDGNRVSSATSYSYKMTADGVVFRANFVKESELVAPVLNWAATNLTVGVAYSVAPKAFGAEASASSGVDGAAAVKVVSVTGLPKGLAWKSGKVTGVPTAAGAKTVSVKVALATNSKKTWTVKHTLVVAALPTWAKGAFVGGWSEGVSTNQVTLTVGSTGKVSGKLSFANAVWTLSAASYATGSATGGVFTVKATATKGKTKKTVAITVGENALGGFAFSETAGFAFEAQQNLWKTDETWQGVAAALAGSVWSEEDVTVTFGANGVAAAKFRVGANTFSASATLCPTDIAAGKVKGCLYLYFAPNTKKKFKGVVRVFVVDAPTDPRTDAFRF